MGWTEKLDLASKRQLGHEIGKAAAEKSRGLFSADDWQCGRCGNVNWARRQSCNMCNAPKFGEVEERTGLGGGYNERESVEYVEREDSDGEYDDVQDGIRAARCGECAPAPRCGMPVSSLTGLDWTTYGGCAWGPGMQFGRRKKRPRREERARSRSPRPARKREEEAQEEEEEEEDEEEEEENEDEDDDGDLSKYDLTAWDSAQDSPRPAADSLRVNMWEKGMPDCSLNIRTQLRRPRRPKGTAKKTVGGPLRREERPGPGLQPRLGQEQPPLLPGPF
ncbi:hypothetical protein HPB48_025311 [Haemaphysalis longicornis]|uniref:RanBP2-type domain-containing protein n=1 Tax=Haemaphysalis longicornis TaxID=44386 RepID=A0A9J6H948_HAELO|nr:hypothetical protein HPB48_025311 [Haemaphysalis longicornis]